MSQTERVVFVTLLTISSSKDTLICLPAPIFAGIHTGISVFFRPTPFSYFSSLTDSGNSPLKYAHMAVTGIKGFSLPPRDIHCGERSADWWRDGRAGFDAWAEASKIAGEIAKLVEQRIEDAYLEAVERLTSGIVTEWEDEVKRLGDIAADDWKEAWRRSCTEKGAVLTDLIHVLANLYASIGDPESQCDVLEKLLSQRAFGHMRRGRWYDDLSRILQKRLRRPDEAYQWIRKALDPDSEKGEGVFRCKTGRLRELMRRAAMLEIELDVPLDEAIIDHEEGFFEAPRRVIDSGVDYFGNGEWDGNLSVEEVAINWFSENGDWLGAHAENGIIGIIVSIWSVWPNGL